MLGGACTPRTKPVGYAASALLLAGGGVVSGKAALKECPERIHDSMGWNLDFCGLERTLESGLGGLLLVTGLVVLLAAYWTPDEAAPPAAADPLAPPGAQPVALRLPGAPRPSGLLSFDGGLR